MAITNFDSWIEGGKYSLTMPNSAFTVVGVPNTNSGDSFLPVTVPVTAFVGSNIGKQLGGGIVVGEWDENGVKKALIASLTNVSTALSWSTVTSTASGATSFSNGSTNTDTIIAQTTAPAAATYAAGITRLFPDGGYSDWYLPAIWELNMCYNAAAIVNKVLGATAGFIASSYYWSSTENNNVNAWGKDFSTGLQTNLSKTSTNYVRAVRIHTL